MIELTKDNFETETANGTVLVDFWAEWCGPCRILEPVVEHIDKEYANLRVAKLNIDNEPELAEEFDVLSIPSILLFKDGNVVSRSIGAKPKERLESDLKLDSLL